MDHFPDVQIDKGKFKYILIKLTDPQTKQSKYIVRGFTWAGYHVNILESLEPDFKQYKIAFECVGGGRILHKPDEKTIRVYGFSQGFGQADHSKTCELLRKHYPDYKVDWSNEGY